MDPKITDKQKRDILITRRQMLQNVGGFSLVAAGVLVLPPSKAEAGNLSSILPLLLEEPGPYVFNEGFESGGFTTYAWEHPGTVGWSVVSAEKYQGSYSARSGAIGHNASTELKITLSLPEAGYISFYRKVSSETNYDYLRFYVDGVQKGSWSGLAAWSRDEYAVTVGQHTLKWIYSKDASVSSNSDCAWIDEIVFIPDSAYSDWVNSVWSNNAWSNYSDTWHNYSDYGAWGNWMQSW